MEGFVESGGFGGGNLWLLDISGRAGIGGAGDLRSLC
jgi:hypothetical protein